MHETEIKVADADFEAGDEALLALGRDAGLLEFEELSGQGDDGVVQMRVESRCDERRLSSLEYVDQWTHVADREGSHLYVVSVSAPPSPERRRDPSEGRVGPESGVAGRLGDDGDAGAAPKLRAAGESDGRGRPLYCLTNRQREVVETAWEMGYYEVPREVPASAVAAELGLDGSTVSEHLQRAERNLLSELLSD
ncbi:helix-turn-helix domain-containing protein [Halorussus marinus]|uniref:helix-turn-helix domain-containing protein n=1 Tax=Halorussus marinus TaxID=2505976 RepID=UPI001091AB52|nr:helix-turn-helix domain-containing protein [Halorussus marinus]